MWSRFFQSSGHRFRYSYTISSSLLSPAGSARPLLLVATLAATGCLHQWSEKQNRDKGDVVGNITTPTVAQCDGNQKCADRERAARLIRKRTTLEVATANSTGMGRMNKKKSVLQRLNTKEELDKLREKEKEMLLRWERDEDGWRELPARAWPAYQPNPQELEGIMAEIAITGCDLSGGYYDNVNKTGDDELDDECTNLLFDMATSFIFYGLNPAGGFAQYERLASLGHVDSMVACGIILVEGLGVPPREKEGIAWLQKAIELSSSAQAYYELGTIYYTGIDGTLEEDAVKAFEHFEKAAEQDHPAGLYMMADCLVEGEGTERSVARAVPLFYKAAERGHRFARQRIRELLARLEYPL
jgi:hypothetical protein